MTWTKATPQLLRRPKALRVGSYTSAAPPRMVEYAYYATLFYGITAPGLGLVVPMLAGGMLLVLAVFCVIRLGPRATAVYAPIRLLFACAISFLAVQFMVHNESVMEENQRGF